MNTVCIARPALAALMALQASLHAAQAQSPASIGCPPYYLLSVELAANPGFELPESGVPVGSFSCWSSGDPAFPPSAAQDWTMHSSNAQHTVCSRLLPSTAPGSNGGRMLQVRAGGNEGGVYQLQVLDPGKSYMFSAWVKVRRGQVRIYSRSLVGGPYSATTKVGEWEQLRVCTNGLTNVDSLGIFNQDPRGGDFYVDRVELREIPTL